MINIIILIKWLGSLTCDEPSAEEECDETLDGVGGLRVLVWAWDNASSSWAYTSAQASIRF